MMADAAAVRREIRRRRILENIDKRLQLISGKSDECLKDPSIRCSTPVSDQAKIRFPVLDKNSEVPASPSTSSSCFSPIGNGVLIAEPESQALLSPTYDFDATGDNEVANDLAAFGGPGITIPELDQPRSPWEKLINYKYDIVLLSLLVQVFYSLSFTIENAYFFLPLIMYTVTKLIWVPAQHKSNIANMFLQMYGVSPNRARIIMSTTQLVGAIAQDICVYLFTTVCIQSFIAFMKNLIT